ncbi:MAG: hypothetical protein OXD54_18475 [Candidatus Poribacteria bacterium]|nr:hypothetical protein [Candidatus Poribacteria bacterium]
MKYIQLNIGMLFLLGLSVLGCGQSLQSLSPIQPVKNIVDAQMELDTNPSAEVVVPAIPASPLANPIIEKHGLQTVGFRLVEKKDANAKALTYVFASPEYAYTVEDWNNFLKDWIEVQPQIELPTADEDRKEVDVVFLADLPKTFDIQARQPFLTKTIDGITVSICYWRRTDLDRKYNRGNAFSPFYETEALRQGDKTDVYYVKITNNRNEHIIFNVKKCEVTDQGDNFYPSLDYDDLVERFTYMSRASGLYVTNGLAKAREILLEKRMPIVERHVGAHRIGVKPGESAEGFVPFRQVKLNALELSVVLRIEKAPPPGGAQRYQTIEFQFPFTHSRGIRVAQPSPQRY